MSKITSILRPVFPPVSIELCRVMHPTLYRYIWKVSSVQQVRLCLLALLLFPLSMAPLEIQRRIVDQAIVSSNIELLIHLSALYVTVLVAHGLLKYAFNVYQSSVGEGVIRILRLRVNESLPDEPAGNRVALTAAEVEQVGGFVGEAVSFPFLQSGILLTTLGYMIWLQPLMATVAVVSVLPSVILTPILQASINRHIQKRVRAVRSLGDRLIDSKQEQDRFHLERANQLVENAYKRRIRIFTLKFLLKGLNTFIGSLGPVGILLFGGWLVITGDSQLGTVVAFISGFERLTTPTRELLNFYRRISQVNVQYSLLVKTLC